ncbi:7133_t:CDS:2 [Gigaspora margarita]|uniref:7133_t:CDS:1 n=1 Tax=Gigaspora margarita TaxID=4874 RepID=A0ABM8W0P5_GIGMA|nr:7133_t:CDS:2 [Gigaspora margarita]
MPGGCHNEYGNRVNENNLVIKDEEHKKNEVERKNGVALWAGTLSL